MTASLQQAKRYATLKKTKVIEAPGGYKVQEDGSITFVLESGPKLNMTEKELNKAISEMETARKIESKAIDILNTTEEKAEDEKANNKIRAGSRSKKGDK